MAGRADLAVDLVAALQLGLVELAERTLERPVDVAGLFRMGSGGGRSGREGETERRERECLAQHQAQPFFSGDAAAPAGVVAGCDRTGAEIDSGTGSGVSVRPIRGVITQK